MDQIPFRPADILLPAGQDMEKWSVVACDQHTSEPDYWRETERMVGRNPSTLNITLPEVYLNGADVEERIRKIGQTMREYLQDGLFREIKKSYLYVERTLGGGGTRRGVIGMVDLDRFDYGKGSQTPIRSTEGTVLERIPPRVRVRRNAALEVPHVMLLIDDGRKTVIEPLEKEKAGFEKCYDFSLMQGGGRIKGYVCAPQAARNMENALSALCDPSAFEAKYGVKGKGVLLFAVGDGNHSLAAAKKCYELRKAEPGFDAASSPERYAMVEVVNVHDGALKFEPIHRVLFHADPKAVLRALSSFYELSDAARGGQFFDYVTREKEGRIYIGNPNSHLAVGTLQAFLDDYTGRCGGRVDYIHGEATAKRLGRQAGNIAFLLPGVEKSDLFKTVILDGSLPRKTFSMGDACDKRYYLECRRLSG